MAFSSKNLGLYVHMPFCKSKCPYCDFYSIPVTVNTGFYGKRNAESEKIVYSYIEAVIRNLEFYNERFDTAYFGGGTPSLCYWGISEILSKTRFLNSNEITVEANPGDINSQGLKLLRDSGVNRISLGVQSFANNELIVLGRRHNAEEANNIIKLAFDMGFKNISIDLMLGIPHQTPESLKRTIKVISTLPITHVSAYMLKIEDGTPFAKSDKIKSIIPNEEQTALLYLTAVHALETYGFKQYEISNFAKPGFECKHNLKYWESDEYLGIGTSAHSFYNGERFAVPPDIRGFVKSDVQSTEVTDTKPKTFDEYAMLKLRLTKGLSFMECEEFNISKNIIIERTSLIPPDYINITQNGISLTAKGFLLSNKIIALLVYGK